MALGLGVGGAFCLERAPAVLAQSALTPMKLRLNYTPWGFHASVFLAAERGWFRDGGIDLTVDDGSGSTTAINLTAATQVDIGEASVSAMAAARPHGLLLTSIACIVPGTDLGVLVPRGAGIKTPKDLEGKKVVYTAGSQETPFIQSFLRAGGADPEKVELVNIEISAKFPTYISGKADAAIGSLPYVYPYIQKMRPSDTIMFSDYGFDLMSFGYIVSPQTLKDRRKELLAFVTAIRRSWQEILDNGKLQDGIDALMKNRPRGSLTEDVLKGQIEAYRPLFTTVNTRGKPLGWQARQDWQDTLGTMQRVDMMPKDAKPEDFYTNDFIAT